MALAALPLRVVGGVVKAVLSSAECARGGEDEGSVGLGKGCVGLGEGREEARAGAILEVGGLGEVLGCRGHLLRFHRRLAWDLICHESGSPFGPTGAMVGVGEWSENPFVRPSTAWPTDRDSIPAR